MQSTVNLVLPVPVMPSISDENLFARRKRLLYRANHRGIKEMDIILGGFASAWIDRLTMGQLDEFEEIMQENDRDLLSWFTGEANAPKEINNALFNEILHHQKNAGCRD
jgi:antitoxin CptB